MAGSCPAGGEDQRGSKATALDTLAAAYAEAGRFPDAAATAREALRQATAQGNQHLAESLRKRIKLYDESKPWRDSPSSGPGTCAAGSRTRAAGTREGALKPGAGNMPAPCAHDRGRRGIPFPRFWTHIPPCAMAESIRAKIWRYDARIPFRDL